MSPALPATDAPVTSVAGAITRMEAMAAALPATDGLACFNRMYLDVTRQVNSQLGQGFFGGPEFMAELDVTFADLYFTAASAAGDLGAVPVAWRHLHGLGDRTRCRNALRFDSARKPHAPRGGLSSLGSGWAGWSGDGFAVDLAGAAFGAGQCGLLGGESEPFVEGASSAGIGAGVVGTEGHQFHYAWAGAEAAARLGHEGPADALPAGLLGDNQPAHVIGRRLEAEEQATEHLVPADGDEGRGPADVLVDVRTETRIIDHGTEPVLDLSGQIKEASHVFLIRQSDDHPNSLAPIR
jgi:Family of unknown function (DUF5995)